MVNFENGVTPINDANLNKMQEDIISSVGIENMNITDTTKIIKYKNGLAIVCGKVSGNATNTDFWSDFNRTNNIAASFPITFTTKPTVMVTGHDNGAIISYYLNSISGTGFTFTGIRAKNSSSTSYEISYIAIGQWK